MKKSILNLNGALELSKKEQKSINGGKLSDLDTTMCVCGHVNWGTSQDPSQNNGVGMTFSTQYSEGAVPVGFVLIQPQPACCL